MTRGHDQRIYGGLWDRVNFALDGELPRHIGVAILTPRPERQKPVRKLELYIGVAAIDGAERVDVSQVERLLQTAELIPATRGGTKSSGLREKDEEPLRNAGINMNRTGPSVMILKRREK
jgi:hypothetical protein